MTSGPAPPTRGHSVRRAWLASCLLAAASVGAGCATPSGRGDATLLSRETFEPASPHARGFPVPAGQTCEAARRALLSQGYIVTRATGEQVGGRKSFQPTADAHVEIEFHVVCVVEGRDRATVFVNAVEDRYALKKVSTSASLGVGPVGSLSLPFGSSSDSLVKVASETIPQAVFYERFFGLVEHFLASQEGDDPAPERVDEPPRAPAP